VVGFATGAENVFNFRRIHMHGTKSGPNADPDYEQRYHPGPAQGDMWGHTDEEWKQIQIQKKLREIQAKPIEDRWDMFMSEYLQQTDEMQFAHDNEGNPIMREGYPETRRIHPEHGVAINLFPFQWEYDGRDYAGIQVSEMWRLETQDPDDPINLKLDRVGDALRMGLDLADKYNLPIIVGALAFDPNPNDDLYVGIDYPDTPELMRYYESFGFEDIPDIGFLGSGVAGDDMIYWPGSSGPNR
jgi:hypothetical protein